MRPLLLALPSCALALAFGCNVLTGADDLEVGSGAGAGSTNAGGDGTGNGTGASGTGAAGTGGSGATSSGTGGGGTTTTGTGGASADCAPPCGANQHCEAATLTCVCDPGFVMQGGSCNAAPPGDPSTHTEAEVCQHWQDGHVVTTPSPLVTGGGECEAGSLKAGALVDTLARINMFRWLVGLGPTTDDAGMNATAQKCANLESWWDWSLPDSPHFPPANVKCYTAEGASGAGMSNIAWGSGHPAQAIDQFMEDQGNATTMGHRRWILNPPLYPVGIGYWEGGGMYGNAECLGVFGSSGNGPNPPWVSVPNAGFAPLATAQWTWTFHGSLSGIPNAQISMLRVDDATPLAVSVQTLSQGYGQDCISWTPQGWTPEAGKTYRVTVSGLGGGDVVYDVKPVACP